LRTRRLGATELELSVVGFGAWEAGGGREWGAAPPDDQAVDGIRAALDQGVTWVDTAEIYGDGHSEEVVARAVAGRRDAVLLATKVAPRPAGSGFRPDQVHAACRGSLRRLGSDHIDLYQLHWPDRKSGIPVEETWGAMAELAEQGQVRAIGVSNFPVELVERCLTVRPVDSVQLELSLLEPTARGLLPWFERRQVGVLTYGSLAYALLSGGIDATTTFAPEDFRGGAGAWGYYRRLFAPERLPSSLAVVEGLRPIAESLGLSLARLAIAWNIQQPGVTSALAGSRRPDHSVENAGAAGTPRLDEATLRRIEAVIQTGPAFGGDRQGAT
jgi:aryl-alcohol dehydrogenase-like predicted oxidoreductase